jgi:NAD(P)-dependent dehydrogenase (short-subunit alcohol dehydrogenase family)
VWGPASFLLQGKLTVKQLDLADLHSVKKFADEVSSELGKLDLLVLNGELKWTDSARCPGSVLNCAW